MVSHSWWWWRLVAVGRLGNVTINYFTDSEETVSNGVCTILSMGKPSIDPLSEEPTGSEIRGYHPGKFLQISCVIIAVEKLPRRRRRKKCDASTNQSNNFGVSRKRFKLSTPGSKHCRIAHLVSWPNIVRGDWTRVVNALLYFAFSFFWVVFSLCIFLYYFVSTSQMIGCEDCLRNDLGLCWVSR